MTNESELVSADRLMERAGKTFYRAARLLPAAVRSEVVALYAFCRRVDDLADEPLKEKAKRRQDLGFLLQQLRTGKTFALGLTLADHSGGGVLCAAATTLVEAALADLDQEQPLDEAALLGYAFGVAGTVGVMMAKVLGADPAGVPAAVSLGIAMQLSNIARDVAEDLAQGRVYLPASRISGNEVHLALNRQHSVQADLLQQVTISVLALAERFYQAAYDGIWSLPWQIRWSILAAAMCYREIGVQVARDVQRSWRQRTVVSNGRKLLLIAAAGARLLLPRFWKRPRGAALVSNGAVLTAGIAGQLRSLGVAP